MSELPGEHILVTVQELTDLDKSVEALEVKLERARFLLENTEQVSNQRMYEILNIKQSSFRRALSMHDLLQEAMRLRQSSGDFDSWLSRTKSVVEEFAKYEYTERQWMFNDTRRCANCGRELNEGESKCFVVCDDCWDKDLPNPGAIARSARRETNHG